MYEKKSPFECPSVEDISKDVTYAFTFNPSDGYQEWDQPLRINRFIDRMVPVFDKLSVTAEVEATLEISKGGRLHYHGIIKFKNILNFFVDTVYWLRTVGTYCIKEIEDVEKWTEYCGKQVLIPSKQRTMKTPEFPKCLTGNFKSSKVVYSGKANKRSISDY